MLETHLLLRPENIPKRTCSQRRFLCTFSRKNKLFIKTNTKTNNNNNEKAWVEVSPETRRPLNEDVF